MFGVVGKKEPLIERDQFYQGNSQKTLTSKNLSASWNFSANRRHTTDTQSTIFQRPVSAMASLEAKHVEKSPSLEDLEFSLAKLKHDLRNLNDSLEDNYAKSRIFARDSNYDERRYFGDSNIGSSSSLKYDASGNDEDMAMLFRRKDKEAVSHLPPQDSKWFRDPKHLSTSMGDFEASESQGVSAKMISPRNREVGVFGAEMATKNIDGQLTATDLASNLETFPVRLTAPHIVGIRSLAPPKIPVKKQQPTSPSKERSSEVTIVPYFPAKSPAKAGNRMPDPKPHWMPVSKSMNACSKPPPEWRRPRPKSSPTRRSATHIRNGLIAEGRPVAHHKTMSSGTYPRQIHPLPSETELRFLTSADQIDTRRALVENSPYQQELARLRLTRLRVEEEYLLQLKRESELERIRGPKPKWYEMTGPEFHYECNKNTTLHKNNKSWATTLQYRNELLQSSRDFAQSIE